MQNITKRNIDLDFKNYEITYGQPIPDIEITENKIIWLKETSDNTSAWYGLDNTAGVFEKGSKFWVRWLNKKSDPKQWQNYYNNIDRAHKTDVEDDNLWIFLIGVTKPDGTEYTNFGTTVPLYVQLGDDWDKNDLNAMFIADNNDETVKVTYIDNQKYPEGVDSFGILHLKHFSPYAVYDELNEQEEAAQNAGSKGTPGSSNATPGSSDSANTNSGATASTNANSGASGSSSSSLVVPKTGDNYIEFYIALSSLMVAAAALMSLKRKKYCVK